MLELKALSKQYNRNNYALNNINLTIPQGQIAALIGSSGAGKSTLIRCINRLIEPSMGTVVFNNIVLTDLNSRNLRNARRQIGMIFQQYALIERLTVMENVLAGRLGYVGFFKSWFRHFPQKDIEQAYGYLDRVGLSGFENARADTLSGGQKQRVGIARALMQEPMLLLVDEPTASLDPKTARQVMRIISDLCREQKLTAIVNLHDVALAKQFTDRIIGLQKGTIVFDDRPEKLNEEAMSNIYGEENWAALAPSTEKNID